MKTIGLTLGFETLIDDADYLYLPKFRWRAHKTKNNVYAATGSYPNVWFMQNLLLKPGDALRVDHIDRNGLNNQRENLRIVTHSQNCFNKQTKDKFRGITYLAHKQYWRAQVKVEGKVYYQDGFSSPEEAALHYDKLVKKHVKIWTPLNF